jgi:GTPase SAR1 family protein
VSVRNSPILIGIVGASNAGKTTFLGMIYTLLLNGKKFKAYDFAGTNTITGWDELYSKLIIQKGTVAFPEPTHASVNRLYHIALRNKNGMLKDLLFSDASGEVFTLWAQNRNDESAENARWIYANCNAFILFIDCDALISKMNLAKKEIIDIAQQLSHNLLQRPIISVWSKSDKKRSVHPQIKNSLKEKLNNIFVDYHEIDISNFLDPGPDRLIHKNNLKVVDWLMKRIDNPPRNEITLAETKTNDIFLNYKGNE